MKSAFLLLLTALLSTPALAQESAPDTLLDATHDSLSGQPAPSLPNGASAITENFDDWTLNCAIQQNTKICSIGQAQGNSQTGQQIFAIELRAPVAGTTEGVLILPFGLAIHETVSLQIDGKDLGQGAHFTTCIPAGCIVPLAFPQVAIDALKSGKDLVVTAPTLATEQKPAEFTVSLTGLTAAITRLTELAK